RQSLRRRCVVLSVVCGGESRAHHRGPGVARRGPHRVSIMKARSFSHVGITVSDFNKAVRFYWDVFGCPLVGVADTPPERVRAFFGVEGPSTSLGTGPSTSLGSSGTPSCKIGWIRVPGGAVLEIFEFQPQLPPTAVVWNRVGLTHISFNVRNLQKWHDYLT